MILLPREWINQKKCEAGMECYMIKVVWRADIITPPRSPPPASWGGRSFRPKINQICNFRCRPLPLSKMKNRAFSICGPRPSAKIEF